MNFEGKIALVTGASRGIGRAIAETLAARGAKVIGTATSENGAQAISDYLGANGKGLMLNVTDPASIESVLEKIRAEFGEVDILVNNAGITRDNLLMRMKDEEWNDIIETNPFICFPSVKSGNARYDEKASWSYYHYRFCGWYHGKWRSGQLRCGESGLDRLQ
ncbi:3-oxoacyl-ACP reductase [Escherichia coli]|uniref:3-oxoacyl-ACP reductase n=1 Tax=Escherichia coli TaxID=562 RepID=A0A376KXD0_ECOLX|nr:3-oxoacyl-ACP reductase [Escherichia coli]